MPDQEFGSDSQVRAAEKLPDPPAAASEKPDGPVDQFAASEPASAAQRLREFEDEHLGPDAPRVDGKIERGHGSLFSRMTDAHKARHTKLEHLHQAEGDLAQAASKLSEAQAAHAQAVAALDESKNGSG